MSIEIVIFCVGLSIGICLSAILIALERLKTESDNDLHRLGIVRDIQKLKADIEELKHDSKLSLRP